jgi:hypothetical protein
MKHCFKCFLSYFQVLLHVTFLASIIGDTFTSAHAGVRHGLRFFGRTFWESRGMGFRHLIPYPIIVQGLRTNFLIYVLSYKRGLLKLKCIDLPHPPIYEAYVGTQAQGFFIVGK